MRISVTAGQLSHLVRRLIAFSGWRAAQLVALMIAAALSEGLGLILIVPLLAFTGASDIPGSESRLIAGLEQAAARNGVTFSFEVLLIAFLVLVVLRQLLVYFGARMTANTRIDFVADIRKEFFAALGATSWRFLSGGRLDKVGQVLLIDSWRIGEAALHFLRILSGVVLLFASVAVAVIISPLLSTSILAVILVLTLLFGNRLYWVQKQGAQISEIHNNVYRVVENYLDNLRTARMAGATRRMQADFASEVQKLGDQLSGFVKETETIRMSLQIAGATAIAVALYVAVRLLHIAGPELLLLVFIAARFIPRVSVINQDLHRLVHDLPAFEQASRMLDECRENPDLPAGRESIDQPQRSIGVANVTVVFDENRDSVILNDLSFSLAVGEMVAITGPSGAGKSTLVDVFAGLLEPDGGGVRIDDRPLDRDSLRAWREQVGYVSQSSGLLQDTIRQNLIWVSRDTVSEEALGDAIRAAEFSAVAAGLQDGLDTIVGRREGRLSGGERQRIAIARELLRNPRLLILDEATNALDVETENRLLSNLRRAFPALTILIVAHRDTAIALADRVIRMDKQHHA